MRYITPSILLAVVTLCCVFLFLLWCAAASGRNPLSQGAYRFLWWLGLSPAGPLPLPDEAPKPRLSFAGKRHPMEKKDRLPILLITLVYALTAFFQLGDTTAPQEFVDFSGQTITVEISGDVVLAQGIRYYTGLGTGKYNVEVSSDGDHWSTLWPKKEDPNDAAKVTGYYWADAQGYSPSYALTQNYNQLFKWVDLKVDNPINIRYIRITGKADKTPMELARFTLLDTGDKAVPVQWSVVDSTLAEGEGANLFYAGDAPVKSTWHNSTYFDEIYHARTAKEHIGGVYPYEVTHPPMGKLILGIGIRLFGMTPFGWRFSGTLLGVLMLPILYIFLKNLFGKTVVATCGTILFAADFMHLTHTRIATIDTYGLFFILGMYFFMYRYLTLPAGTPFWKGALPLFLSGLMWGLGAASKWTVFYAGIGLAVVYFMGFYQKLRDWPQESETGKGGWVATTLLFSVVCFIVIPFAIYVAAYIPYAKALGVELFAESEANGLAILFQNVLGKFTGGADFVAQTIPKDNLLNIMANNQWYMFTYHNGVTSSHPYASWWFQWVVDGRPILYYMDNTVPGHTTRFAAFANPVVCWGGFGAIVTCAAHTFRRLWAKLAFLGGTGAVAAVILCKVQQTPNGVFDPTLAPWELKWNFLILCLCLVLYLLLCLFLALAIPGHSGKAAFLLVGFLSQLVPWWFIGRTTFEYHYFPSILFLVLAISYLFDRLVERGEGWKVPVYGLTGLTVGLYALFYPVLIGLQIPSWYQPLVKWIESWPF